MNALIIFVLLSGAAPAISQAPLDPPAITNHWRIVWSMGQENLSDKSAAWFAQAAVDNDLCPVRSGFVAGRWLVRTVCVHFDECQFSVLHMRAMANGTTMGPRSCCRAG